MGTGNGELMIADCSKGVTSDEKKAGVGNQESEVRRTREQGTGNREQGTGNREQVHPLGF
jgi:hypothetical protein